MFLKLTQKFSLRSRGSLHKKRTEIYWSFINTGGGGYPPTNIFPGVLWLNLFGLNIFILGNM